MRSLALTLVALGLVLTALGALLYVTPSVPLLGRLPGDFRIERSGFRFYFPLTTCLVISLVLTAVWWIVSKLR